MAWVDGKWLNRNERENRIKIITERVSKLKALYETGKATDIHVDTLLQDAEELKKLKRIHRSEHDMLFFMHTYFSEELNPGNPDNLIPKGVTINNAADFHNTLCHLLDEITEGKQKTNVAWSVGRGHAKTAYL